MNRSAQNPLRNSLGSDKVVSATKQRGINNLNSTLPNSSWIPGIAQKHKHESFDFSSTGGSITKKNEIQNISKQKIFMETSQSEQVQGVNISYENSFTAIKRDILKETVDKHRQIAQSIKNGAKLRAPIPKAVHISKQEDEPKDMESESESDQTPNKPEEFTSEGITWTVDLRDEKGLESGFHKQKSPSLSQEDINEMNSVLGYKTQSWQHKKENYTSENSVKISLKDSVRQERLSDQYNSARDAKTSKLYSSLQKQSPVPTQSKIGKIAQEQEKYSYSGSRKPQNYYSTTPQEPKTIPIEPSIPKPAITPKSRMIKAKNSSQDAKTSKVTSASWEISSIMQKNKQALESSRAAKYSWIPKAGTTEARDMTVYRGPF